MTTPNLPWDTTSDSDLPQGVISPADLGTRLQQHNPSNYTDIAANRFPAVAQSTAAGSARSGPLGFVVGLFSQITSGVATADPATIKGPDDIVAQAGNFFHGLPLLSLIGDIAQAITGAVGGGFNTITSFFDDLLGGALQGINPFSVFSRIGDIFFHQAAVSNTATAAFTAATNNTVAITDLTTIVNAQRTTQAYVGNLTDMPTVPRALLIPRVNSASFSGAGHQHTYNPSATGTLANTSNVTAGGTVSLSRSIPSFTPQVNKVTSSAGTAYFTPIVVDRAGVIDKFRFITGVDSSLFPVDAYYVGLYILDTSGSAPQLLKFWDPGDISGSMGSSLNEVAVTTALSTSAGTVAPGQVLFAAHQQSAPGLIQPNRSVAWVPQSGVGRTTDVLLQGAYYSLANQSGLPSSVALSALTANNDGIPWYAVSVNS